MYQRDSLVTFGSDMLVLVTKDGKGIENFRIFSETDSVVDVGYSLVDVKTPVIRDYNAKGYRELRRAYYVLDLKEYKIYRVDAVNAWGRFPERTRKKAVVLAKYTDAEYSIKEYNGELRCKCDVNNSKYWDTKAWADADDMPGSIHVLDLEHRQVHKVSHLIFLN